MRTRSTQHLRLLRTGLSGAHLQVLYFSTLGQIAVR